MIKILLILLIKNIIFNLFEFILVDLESLTRFLDEPRVDLDSLGYLELNGMIEIFG